MTVRCPLVLALLALGACAPAAEQAADESMAAQDAPTGTTSATTIGLPSEQLETPPADALPASELPGEYRVAGIDGEELNAPVGVAVSITESTIILMPCAGLAWTYTYNDAMLETKRIPVPPRGIVCRIPIEVARAGVALAEATRVRRTSANGIEFSGGGRSVHLFSQ